MNPIRRHFQLHGAVHAFWVIGILIAVVAALLLLLPNGNAVGDYIAFAASIASLVLAVVAIGQSLISNQGFAETLGSLRQSSESLQNAAVNVERSSSSLSSKMDEFAGQVSQVPAAVEALGAKFEAMQASSNSGFAIGGDFCGREDVSTEAKLSRLKFATSIMIYAAARSYERNALFNSAELVDEDAKSFWAGIMTGASIMLIDTKPFGIQADMMMSDGQYTIKVTNMGDLDTDTVIKTLRSANMNHDFIEKVDTYFDKQVGKRLSSSEESEAA